MFLLPGTYVLVCLDRCPSSTIEGKLCDYDKIRDVHVSFTSATLTDNHTFLEFEWLPLDLPKFQS